MPQYRWLWLFVFFLACGDSDTEPSDADGDGFSEAFDCDDNNADINPNATEVCDGVDNNCDGETDGEDAEGMTPWYADGDGDGFGDAEVSQEACEAPEGYVADATDCDDADDWLRPDDQDGDGFSTCDGDCDDDDSAATPADVDGDGYSSCDGDCDDDDFSVSPEDRDEDGFTGCEGDCDDFDPAWFPADHDVETTIEESDVDGDGAMDQLVNILALRDMDGNVVDYRYEADSDLDGVIELTIEQTITYDPSGNLLTGTILYTYEDGTSNLIDIAYTYDSDGNRLTYTYLVDYDHDGNFEYSALSLYSYDADGNLITSERRTDSDNDGEIDYGYTYTYAYDANGNMVLEEYDSGSDGRLDQSLQTANSYDTLKQLIYADTSVDDGADGTVEYGYAFGYTYTDGLVDSKVYLHFDSRGFPTETQSTLYTYDEDGNVLSEAKEYDYGADSSVERLHTTVSTYDADSRLLTRSNTRDEDMNGVIDYSNSSLYTYDEMGYLLTYRYERDDDGNGAYDFLDQRSSNYTYACR